MSRALIRDIIQWDVKSWSKALHYWETHVEWEKVHACLELGGREGGLSLWLALKGKVVVCSDLDNVKNTASPLHRRYHVSERITYRDIDATNIPYENFLDVVVFKSILGGIGRNDNHAMQARVFKEAHKALKPGGKLLFAENLIASPLHRFVRKKFVSWGSYWRYVSLSEMNEFLKEFSAYDIKAAGVLAAFGRTERQRGLLASADEILLNHVCPDRWKYIAYGIAEK